MDIVITMVEDRQEAFESFLSSEIKKFNNEHSPFHLAARKPINIILTTKTGTPIGGLSGSTYWDWLDINNFYIPEALRGQGIGADLLQRAETIAVGRGCKRSFLTTFEFQARTFYEKQGYFVTGTLQDYPPGSTYYWMRKDLSR